ncbi:MAG: hypothetical protein QXD89_01060 [Candidatus Aenigmatarchaeota archaeon]
MEIFGFELQTLIFQIFLPFLLFYILLFIFLKRSKIFSFEEKKEKYYCSLISLLISLISILSLYYMNLTKILPYLTGFLALAAFFLTYVYGILKHSEFVVLKQNYFEIIKKIEELIDKFEKETSEENKQKIKKELKERINLVSKIAEREGKKIEQESWYKKAKEIVG